MNPTEAVARMTVPTFLHLESAGLVINLFNIVKENVKNFLEKVGPHIILFYLIYSRRDG